MKRKSKHILSIVSAAVLTFGLTQSAFAVDADEETQWLKQVPFSAVTQLEYQEPTTRLTYGSDESQFIETWASNGRAEIHPNSIGLLLVHGGCWLKDYGVDHIRPMASALAARGFNVFAIEYRRTGQDGGGWPGSLEDVNAAMKLVREQHPQMVLTGIGHSAGGHLALLAATDPGLKLNAIIGLAAITDVSSYGKGENGCQKATASFMGGTEEARKEEYAAANTRNKNVIPPLYLLTGKADKIVPLDQHRHPQAKKFAGEGIGHFDWIHPESEAYQRLINTLSRLYD